jgi:Ni/Co efflux regulator RcnB
VNNLSIQENEMKNFSLTLTGLFLALTAASGAVQAQGSEWHKGRDQSPMDQQRGDYRPNGHDAQQYNYRQERGHRSDGYQAERFDQRGPRWNDRSDFYNARGPEFRRGGHLPSSYYNRSYFVQDYRRHNLPPPPHHHQWVQVGADYVLVAIATGIIANIIVNH